MKNILTYLGGSHAYGLNTPASDKDVRGIFMHTDMSYIIGLNRHEHQENIAEGADEKFKEVRHFLGLLRKANTEALEALFLNPKDTVSFEPEMQMIWAKRGKLLDSAKLFSCLMGYMQGELRLANGERTGKLGGKRKAQIDEYGFSPKNFVNLFRLAWCGARFFEEGLFPVNVAKYNPAFGEWLLEIKTQPKLYTKERLNAEAALLESELKAAFETRRHTYVFDLNAANRLCLDIYGDSVNQAWLNA